MSRHHKIIIEFANLSRDFDLELLKRLLQRRIACGEDAVVFYREDKKISSEYRNRPLYVITSVHYVELMQGLADLGSFLNIMTLSTLEEVEIPREHVFE